MPCAIAGILTILTINATAQQPLQQAVLLKRTPLTYATDVSALEVFQKTLFVIGKNATRIWVHTPDHVFADSLILFDYDDANYPAQAGPRRLRTTAMVKSDNQPALLIMGSGSSPSGSTNIWVFPLRYRANQHLLIPTFMTTDFFKRLRREGIKNFNIDGSSAIGDKMLLGIRAAAGTETKNYLLATELDYWQRGYTASIRTAALTLPTSHAGISGMEYDAPHDRLFFVTTEFNREENIANQLCMIEKAAALVGQKKVAVENCISLNQLLEIPAGHRLQSVTIDERSTAAQTLLQLASSNTQGESIIYLLSLTWASSSGNNVGGK